MNAICLCLAQVSPQFRRLASCVAVLEHIFYIYLIQSQLVQEAVHVFFNRIRLAGHFYKAEAEMFLRGANFKEIIVDESQSLRFLHRVAL